MGHFARNYENLRPDITLLSDEAVLAQAWKKSDYYIRRYNWYADVLALDRTQVFAHKLIPVWSKSLRRATFRQAPLRLVPAPKNRTWRFEAEGVPGVPTTSWRPEGTDAVSLRPLAHVEIREQTVATAVMLCLADAVETMQGCTDQASYLDAQREKVYSYGNRLFCDWQDVPGVGKRAKHRWGATNTYSQYFVDYQRFLSRPADVCRDWSRRTPDVELFVVKFDLTKFYDKIDRSRLCKRMEEIYRRFAVHHDREYDPKAKSTLEFWERVDAVFGWEWHKNDVDVFEQLAMGYPPKGLPQGLVASGFFANVHLWRLDRQIGRQIGSDQGTPQFRLLDYARYVDDMRIVVSVPERYFERHSPKELHDSVTGWMKAHLDAYPNGKHSKLEINERKTEMTAWQDFSRQGRASEYMKSLQGQISTVPDYQTLREVTTNLSQLVSLADALGSDEDVVNNLELSRIATPKVDVRDDTIKRYAAHRLVSVFRSRRAMTTPDVSVAVKTANNQELESRDAVDHEMEAVARKLVYCWARNPALTVVLRRAFDLFPDPTILQPVVEALELELNATEPAIKAIACYATADILRAGSVETGYADANVYPDTADIPGYRKVLEQWSRRLLRRSDVPWYVLQQAALFLGVQHSVAKVGKDSELALYRHLHAVLANESTTKSTVDDRLALALVVQRLRRDEEGFSAWLKEYLDPLSAAQQRSAIQTIWHVDAKLLVAARRCLEKTKPAFLSMIPANLPGFDKDTTLAESGIASHANVRLSVVSGLADNPFMQENALLKLCDGLLSESLENPKRLTNLRMRDVDLKCSSWARVQNPKVTLRVILKRIRRTRGGLDKAFEPPVWSAPSWHWAYALGRLLRSAIVGADDWSTGRYELPTEPQAYRGIRSVVFKRQHGLQSALRGIGKEPIPLSSWFNELLLHLLKWPGLELTSREMEGIELVNKPSDLLAIVRRRMAKQAQLYCRQSEMPGYLFSSDGKERQEKDKFRVALVQTAFPSDTDFNSKNPLYFTPDERAKHTSHVASMCHLVHRQLIASSVFDRGARKRTGLDLIVFPELSIHPSDSEYLARLSDATGATIFAGLTFIQHPNSADVANTGMWIVRQETRSGRILVPLFQGKQHVTAWEAKAGVKGHRPCQIFVELGERRTTKARITAAICYDATDLKLAADLRDKSDCMVISALNRDTNTFDTMATALQYHMYQPVVLVNSGQYGGSTAQAPYSEQYNRLITHLHGANQVGVSIFELDMLAFRHLKEKPLETGRKTPPAGYEGRRD